MNNDPAMHITDRAIGHGQERAGLNDDEDQPGKWYREQERVEKTRRKAERIYRRYWSLGYSSHGTNRHWTPWLLIRYAAADLGLRPIAAGNAYYLSPDIWVESSNPLGQPVAGEPNFIHTRIYNLGIAGAAPVKVDFFWANPAIGAGPANMNFIGTEWVEIPSQTSRVVRCTTPWVPVLVNDGHECLMVNCSNHVLDPILHPFHPRLDRHVGQRNLHVLDVQPGSTITFPLEVNNVLPLRTAAIITARLRHMVAPDPGWPAHGDMNLLQEIAEFGAQTANTGYELVERLQNTASATAQRVAMVADARKRPRDGPTVKAVPDPRGAAKVTARWLDDAAIAVPEEPGRWYAELLAASKLLRDGHRQFDPSRDVPIERIHVQPFELRRVAIDITVPHDARPGEVASCELVQWEEGFAIGGYTIVMNVG